MGLIVGCAVGGAAVIIIVLIIIVFCINRRKRKGNVSSYPEIGEKCERVVAFLLFSYKRLCTVAFSIRCI